MPLEDVLSNEKTASAAQGTPGLKAALEKLADSLEKLDPAHAPGFVAHIKALGKNVPAFYGEIPQAPIEPADPYDKPDPAGDLPTHDAVIEYEDNVMFYRNECKAFAKELAKACRAGGIQ